LESNGYILRWSNEDVEVELLINKPNISLPEKYSVSGCIAALWRIKAKRNLENIRFNALWKDGYKWTNQGVESGEHLDAITWDDEKTKATLGIQDGEVIASRIKNNLMMPVELNKNVELIGLVVS
jgi:hypothetical protein